MRRNADTPYVLDRELYTSPQDKLKYPMAIDNERAHPYTNPAYTAKTTMPSEHGTRTAQLPGKPSRETLVDAKRLADYRNGRDSTTKFADGSFNHYTYLMQQAPEANGTAGELFNRLTEESIPRPKTQWVADVAKGMVPITSFINPLQTQITNIGVRPIPPDSAKIKNQLYDIESLQRLFQIHNDHPVKVGKSFEDGIRHINVEAPTNASALQTQAAQVLNHKKIPKPVYEAFKNFDDVTKAVKNGSKALAAIGIALDVYELGSTIYLDLNDEDKKLGKQTLKTSVGIGAGWAVGAAGAKFGAMGGAAIGTLICPGLGTVIGGFIGGIGGGIAGALGARALGEYIVDETYKGR